MNDTTAAATEQPTTAKRRGRKPGSKNKPKRDQAKKRAKKAPRRELTSAMRIGLFNDGGLLIVGAKAGEFELTADEAALLAGFCHDQFAREA